MTAAGDLAAEGRAAARRPRKVVLLVAITAALALLCCTGGAGAFFLSGLGGDDQAGVTGYGCGLGGPLAANGKLPRVNPYGEAQVRNAAVIINVGAELKVPPRGWVIAVATAMQESRLTNLPHLGARNDHDSVGLFQQRPSEGWGTPAQLQDPVYASRKFYEKLVKVPGWAEMALTDAAQAVQRSAFPDAYAKHEPLAAHIVNMLADGAARAAGAAGALGCAPLGAISASGWVNPVNAFVGSGFQTPDRPSHNGVDLIIGRGEPIRAASSGVVLVSRCDTDDTAPFMCDSDGSPDTPGCGWYVDMLHAGNVITRYCHMVERPFYDVGESVPAGEVIGKVGTSGHSSGPHLHFEVHLNGDRSSAGAVNPVPFMRERGAPLGDDS